RARRPPARVARPRAAPAPARRRSSVREGEVVAVVEREARRAEQPRHDPEADRDLRLGPGLHLEVVVDRRHEEDASPEPLEREDRIITESASMTKMPPIRSRST